MELAERVRTDELRRVAEALERQTLEDSAELELTIRLRGSDGDDADPDDPSEAARAPLLGRVTVGLRLPHCWFAQLAHAAVSAASRPSLPPSLSVA